LNKFKSDINLKCSKDLLDHFKRVNIDFELLSGFFDKNNKFDKNNEIDIWVSKSSKDKFLSFLDTLGFKKRIEIPNKGGCEYYIYFKEDISITLDVKYELHYYEKTFEYWLSKDPVIKNRTSGKRFDSDYNKWKFRLLNYVAECVWVKGNRLNHRHISNIQKYINHTHIENIMNDDLPNVLNNVITKEVGIKEKRKNLEKEIKHYFDKKYSINTYWKFQYKKYKFGLGNTILFLGPDGAGKTSLIDAFSSSLSLKHNKLYLGMGADGWILRSVKWLKFNSKNSFVRWLPLGFLFKYLGFPLELLSRQFKVSKYSKNRIVLIDRYPGYVFLYGKVTPYLYSLILPKPDLIILLTGDAKQIAARKPNETTEARTISEIKKWRKVAIKLDPSRIIEIDTTKNDIDQCKNIIIKELASNSNLTNKVLSKLF